MRPNSSHVQRTFISAALWIGVQAGLGTAANAQQVPLARVTPMPVALDLGLIQWAYPLSGGRVVFSDGGSKLVFIRRRDGSTVQLGRLGDGPGEYRAPENGFLKGDSVLIFASGLAQRTALHLESGTGTTRTMVGVTPDPSCRPLILLTTEGVCEQPRRGDPRAPDHFRDYVRFATGGASAGITPLYRAHDTAYVARLVSGTTTQHLVRPVVWGPLASLSASGTLAFVLEQHLVGSQVEVAVTVTEIATGRRTIHRFDKAATPVSTTSIRAEARRRVDEMAEQGHPAAEDLPRATSQMVAAWAAPHSAPPFRRILGSDSGCFWLEHSRTLGATLPANSAYDRYDAIGRPAGSVAVPLEVLLHSVACTTALGARTDDDGVPELVWVGSTT